MITHIQNKINSLKNEIKAIEYTNVIDRLSTSPDNQRIHDLHIKIQVLNEVIISYKPTKKNK
jgi:hypothetical protein